MSVGVLYIPLTRTACRTSDTPESLFYPASPGDSSCAAARQTLQIQINNAKTHQSPFYAFPAVIELVLSVPG